jgi:ParB/RepB/Spo0J family partition protein
MSAEVTERTDTTRRTRARKPLVDEALLAEVTPDLDIVRSTAPAGAAFFDGRLPLGYLDLPLDKLVPRVDQPRTEFDRTELEELAATIRDRGVLEPILCRPVPERGVYEIVAGERRYRAARLAAIATVPVIARDVTDDDASLDALIENVQRRDLSALEEARALERLLPRFETQVELARSLGWDRQRLSNKLRVLKLDEAILSVVAQRPREFSLRALLDAYTRQEAEGPEAALRVLVVGEPGERRGAGADGAGEGAGEGAPMSAMSRRRRGTADPFRVAATPTRAGGIRVSIVAATTAELPSAIAELRRILAELEQRAGSAAAST